MISIGPAAGAADEGFEGLAFPFSLSFSAEWAFGHNTSSLFTLPRAGFSYMFLEYITSLALQSILVVQEVIPDKRVYKQSMNEHIQDMNSNFKFRMKTLARWLYDARYPVFFTGAGISTESGLSDYRGSDGVWTRQEKGLPPKSMDRPWDQVTPNQGHAALVELQNMGKLRFLISQNVDNLHLKSGIRPENLAELHGNTALLRCQRCGRTVDRSLNLTMCQCGGRFQDSVVHFGQSLPEQELKKSFEHSRKADLFVVLGSSLSVTPAADMPGESLRNAGTLVIVNHQPTPYDSKAQLRFMEGVGEVLPPVVKQLKGFMGLFD